MAILTGGVVVAIAWAVHHYAADPHQAAISVAGILMVGLVATVACLVPWQRLPAPRADQEAALVDLPHEHLARSKQLHKELRPPHYLSMAVSLPIGVILGFTPVGPAFIGWLAAPFGGTLVAQLVTVAIAVIILGEFEDLPFAAWKHVILRRFGLTSQAWRAWWTDVAKGLLIQSVLLALTLTCIYTAISWSPNWWWLWAVGLLITVGLVFGFIAPKFIMPIFWKFTPLEDGPLRERLMALAERDGVNVRQIEVVDASRRTNTDNAAVAGFGRFRRILLFDNLLKQSEETPTESVATTDTAEPANALSGMRLTGASDDQIVTIVAHELAHAKYSDVLALSFVRMVQLMLLFCVLFLLNGWHGLLNWLQVDSITDGRAFFLVAGVLGLVATLFGPLNSLLSRRIEAAADWHALVLTNDAEAFEEAWKRIIQTNLADPDPGRLSYILKASHPSIRRRIAMARAYRRLRQRTYAVR